MFANPLNILNYFPKSVQQQVGQGSAALLYGKNFKGIDSYNF